MRLLFVSFSLLLSTHFLIGQQLVEKTSDFQIALISPNQINTTIKKYHKLELGVQLGSVFNEEINQFLNYNKKGLNPYNPEQVDIYVVFESPSKKQKKAYAFYYEPYQRTRVGWSKINGHYNWRVRIALDELGEWNYKLYINVKDNSYSSETHRIVCVQSEKEGKLIIKKNSQFLYQTEQHKPFFAIGHNITHSAYYKLTPQKAQNHIKWLKELADNGGNFFRLELGGQNALPDWNNSSNYNSKQPQMWEFDNLIEKAEQLNLYFILFRHHTEITTGEEWDVVRWHENSYRKDFRLEKRIEYFTNKDVIKNQKHCLRYIFARWGYSSSFAFYEYQELDNWVKSLAEEEDISEKKAIKIFTDWYINQKSYITDSLNVKDKLFINTYATTPDFELNPANKFMFYHSDVVGFHKYGQHKGINYQSKFDKSQSIIKKINKPFFIEEMGVTAGGESEFIPLYVCSKIEFHNAIWATSFMGSVGTGLHWWWDRGLHEFKFYKDYNALQQFFENEKIDDFDEVNKWSNKGNLKNATIENYIYLSKDKMKAIGWVHNATAYWRNINNELFNELKEQGYFNSPYKFEDGYVIGKKTNQLPNYNSLDDAYSSEGIQNTLGQKIKIKGLRANTSKLVSPFAKSHWYSVKFYSTQDNSLINEQIENSSVLGGLKVRYPGADYDYSYKISYLGKSRKKP